MTRLPEAVVNLLIARLLREQTPAFLLLDGQGLVREAGGALAVYGIAHARQGDDASELLPALHPPTPLAGGDATLQAVTTPSGQAADIAVHAGDDGTLVLLTDASIRIAQQQRLQQRANQARLTERQFARSLPPDVVATLGIAVLHRQTDGSLRLLGPPPAWFHRLWPDLDDAFNPLEQSPFLDHFLDEAAAIWASPERGSRRSGIWTEVDSSGTEWHLEACALWLGSRPILTISDVGVSHGQRRELQQQARDQALVHGRLVKEVEKKDVLLHSIVHDLRSPMVSAHSALQLLAEGDLSSEAQHLITVGIAQLERQDLLIRTILDVFRADSRPRGAPVPVDLAQCVREVAETFAPTFEVRDIELVVDIGDDAGLGWFVPGEHLRLVRVIANLVENALRYSKHGQTVRIDVRGSAGGAVVTVEDEGPGVPQELRGRLFDRFAQGPGNTGSIGLGLHFCRITIEGWGGSIGQVNREARGSRFWFTLPAVASRAGGDAGGG